MTCTNHIRIMQESIDKALSCIDSKEYPAAHLALDDLESQLRKLRRHIDHLQFVTQFSLPDLWKDPK